MSDQEESRDLRTCMKCGKVYDPEETPAIELDVGQFCEECGEEIGTAYCEWLRAFVGSIIDECQGSRRYSQIGAAIGALEGALERDAPDLPRDNPYQQAREKAHGPEARRRRDQALRDAGLDHLIIDKG